MYILASKYLPRGQLIQTPNTKFRNLHCNIEQTTSSVVVQCTCLQLTNVFRHLETACSRLRNCVVQLVSFINNDHTYY